MADVALDGTGPDLELEAHRDGTTVTLSVRGELDAYGAPNLEQMGTQLFTDGAEQLVLDLSKTSFLDSSGLRAILTLHRRVENDRGKFALGSPSDPVARLLEITGLVDHFTILDI
jgi:anti-sigma B factor antagonist